MTLVGTEERALWAAAAVAAIGKVNATFKEGEETKTLAPTAAAAVFADALVIEFRKRDGSHP
jgi:hypothetical protein